MTSTMGMGRTGSATKASKSLLLPSFEENRDAGQQQRASELNIDGGVSLPPEKRRGLPVVLLPILEECGEAANSVADAVHALQQASLNFRVVVVTDSDYFRQLRSYGWAIAHLEGERTYRGGCWRTFARNEIHRIIEAFSCSFVIETSETGISELSWRRLVSLAGFSVKLPNTSRPSLDKSLNFTHFSWRGWLNSVPVGLSEHRVLLGHIDWSLSISRRRDSSMVYVQVKQEPERGTSLRMSPPADWNVVRMDVRGLSVGDNQEYLRALLAVFDGLSLVNSGIAECAWESEISLESLPSSVVRTKALCDADVQCANMRALANWSCM